MRGPLPELNWTPKLDMFPTSSFPLAYHFVAGPGSLTLELGELSPVVDGDEQLPDDQKCKPSQEDAADHSQEDGHGTGGGPTLWMEDQGTVSKPPASPCPPSNLRPTSSPQRSSCAS